MPRPCHIATRMRGRRVGSCAEPGRETRDRAVGGRDSRIACCRRGHLRRRDDRAPRHRPGARGSMKRTKRLVRGQPGVPVQRASEGGKCAYAAEDLVVCAFTPAPRLIATDSTRYTIPLRPPRAPTASTWNERLGSPQRRRLSLRSTESESRLAALAMPPAQPSVSSARSTDVRAAVHPQA
jgi:hypothetical protein